MEEKRLTDQDLQLIWTLDVSDSCRVELCKYQDKKYVVKISADDDESRQILEREVAIYRKLKSLQGVFIPRLEYYGDYQWHDGYCTFFLAVEYSGGSALHDHAQLSDFQKAHLLVGLDLMHGCGVLHGDLRFSNLLFHESNQMPFLIDFGHSIDGGDAIDGAKII